MQRSLDRVRLSDAPMMLPLLFRQCFTFHLDVHATRWRERCAATGIALRPLPAVCPPSTRPGRPRDHDCQGFVSPYQMPVRAVRGARALVEWANSALGAAIDGQTVGFADRTREPPSRRANSEVWITVKVWTRCGRRKLGEMAGGLHIRLGVGSPTSHPWWFDTSLTDEKINETRRRLFTRSANLVRLLRRGPCTRLVRHAGVSRSRDQISQGAS